MHKKRTQQNLTIKFDPLAAQKNYFVYDLIVAPPQNFSLFKIAIQNFLAKLFLLPKAVLQTCSTKLFPKAVPTSCYQKLLRTVAKAAPESCFQKWLPKVVF